MTIHPAPTAVRRAARLLALVPAILVTMATGTAFADPPAQWENNPPNSTLHVLVVMVVIPVALFALIVLLVYLPSMSKGQSYHPGQAWRNEAEWFGGPRDGVERADRGEQRAVSGGKGEGDPGRGGTSARW